MVETLKVREARCSLGAKDEPKPPAIGKEPKEGVVVATRSKCKKWSNQQSANSPRKQNQHQAKGPPSVAAARICPK